MNDILKQRLVGALILVALGVVFWPIIFVEQSLKPLGEVGQIPMRPSVDTTPIFPPDPAGLRPSPEIEANPQVELAELSPIAEPVTPSGKPQVKTRTEAPARPALDVDGVPIGWILQVASVSNPDKAEDLRKRLIAMGYKAYVKKIKTGNSSLLRVYVGPKFERARLESLQSEIDAEFKVKSMVRRYIP